jgi:hypothetical protein
MQSYMTLSDLSVLYALNSLLLFALALAGLGVSQILFPTQTPVPVRI